MRVHSRAFSVVHGLAGLASLLLICNALTASAAADQGTPQFTVLHTFDGTDGNNDYSGEGLILDAAGNLYGTTPKGGQGSFGNVFELTQGEGGQWTETVLYENGGNRPWPNGIVFDAAGNLYGTTHGGSFGTGGTIFELSPGPDGQWTYSLLYTFPTNAWPFTSLIIDSAGSLYGTTYGRLQFPATVFRLTPGADGQWTETDLYNFGVGGGNPTAGVVMDSSGNLYGTSYDGGALGSGFVFELSPGADDQWTFSDLHDFVYDDVSGVDVCEPYGGVVLDAVGNIYGVGSYCGQPTDGGGGGGIFELTQGSDGQWTETVLYLFDVSSPTEGQNPLAALIFDTSGNLYGTTWKGGTSNLGTVFELSPGTDGQWSERALHSFDGSDGAEPFSGVILDPAGNVYGKTNGDTDFPANVGGTVFEISFAYTVSTSVPNGNGSVTPPTAIVNSGDTATFTLQPGPGYQIGTIGGTCGGTLNGAAYTTNPVTANCDVIVDFAAITHIVTPSAGANGSIAPATAQTVSDGDTISFTLTPNPGYQIDAIGGTCGGTLDGSVYTTDPVIADCTVQASFSPITYIVTPGAGPNGSITPDTPQIVDDGATITFALMPDPGYQIGTIGGTCGGTLDGSTFTTNQVVADCTVIASFAVIVHVVTPIAGPHGSIAPSTPQTVNDRGMITFALTPDPGYQIGTVSGTCGGSLAGNSYTTNPVTTDCTVQASFAQSSPPDSIFENGFESE